MAERHRGHLLLAALTFCGVSLGDPVITDDDFLRTRVVAPTPAPKDWLAQAMTKAEELPRRAPKNSAIYRAMKTQHCLTSCSAMNVHRWRAVSELCCPLMSKGKGNQKGAVAGLCQTTFRQGVTSGCKAWCRSPDDGKQENRQEEDNPLDLLEPLNELRKKTGRNDDNPMEFFLKYDLNNF